jgi:hypothetical protein
MKRRSAMVGFLSRAEKSDRFMLQYYCSFRPCKRTIYQKKKPRGSGAKK